VNAVVLKVPNALGILIVRELVWRMEQASASAHQILFRVWIPPQPVSLRPIASLKPQYASTTPGIRSIGTTSGRINRYLQCWTSCRPKVKAQPMSRSLKFFLGIGYMQKVCPEGASSDSTDWRKAFLCYAELGMATTFDSLPASYYLNPGARFLKSTGALHNPKKFEGRLQRTCGVLNQVLAGMLADTGYGLSTMYQLGKTHRGYDDAAKRGVYGSEWTQNADPIISMEGMLWTELTFSVVALQNMYRYQPFWRSFSDGQRNAYTILWSVLGNAMGVPYEFATYADANELFTRIQNGPDMVDRLPKDNPSVQATKELKATSKKFFTTTKKTMARIAGFFNML